MPVHVCWIDFEPSDNLLTDLFKNFLLKIKIFKIFLKTLKIWDPIYTFLKHILSGYIYKIIYVHVYTQSIFVDSMHKTLF